MMRIFKNGSKSVHMPTLMPIEFVPVLFETLKNLNELCQEAQEKLPSFIKYVSSTYIQSETYPLALWNHFKTDDELTNNRVESENVFIVAELLPGPELH